MKIPFIILCHQRPTQLEEMIESIEKFTDIDTYELILIDNASPQPHMIKLLKEYEKKYKVIYHAENLLFLGFNAGLEYIENKERFILSDPDIVLTKKIPSNWIHLLSQFLDEVKTPKVGVALDYTRIPEINSLMHEVKQNTKKIQSNKNQCSTFSDPYYFGSVDTTLAMYRNDTYNYWDGKNIPQFRITHPKKVIIQSEYNPNYPLLPVRVGGRFTCIHTGWEMATKKKYATDFRFYRESIAKGQSNSFIPSTMRYLDGDKMFKELGHNEYVQAQYRGKL